MGFPVAQIVKNPHAMQDTLVWPLDQEDLLEKGMATHSSILVWRIPWAEEPGGLQLMESQRVRHNRVINTFKAGRGENKGAMALILHHLLLVCIMTKNRKLKREEIVAREWHTKVNLLGNKIVSGHVENIRSGGWEGLEDKVIHYKERDCSISIPWKMCFHGLWYVKLMTKVRLERVDLKSSLIDD